MDFRTADLVEEIALSSHPPAISEFMEAANLVWKRAIEHERKRCATVYQEMTTDMAHTQHDILGAILHDK